MRGEKEDLKNPLVSRLVEFDTTLKLLRLTDQWYIVAVVDKFFWCNRMQQGNTKDLYVLRQDVYERFLFSAYNARVLAKMLYTNKLLNSDRRLILRSEEGLKSFNNKNTVLTFLVKKEELSWLSIFWEYRSRKGLSKPFSWAPPDTCQQFVWLRRWLPHRKKIVETSVTINNNSPIQDYVHPDDQTRPTFEMTPGFKPFTV